IRRLSGQGLAILLSEQNAKLSLAIADRGCVIEKGRVTLQGSGRSLLDNPEVAERYLGVGAAVGVTVAQRRERMTEGLRAVFAD
ncbi:MAG: ABC transporter ATP-binding protein, partial [Acidobacteriota bacterium]